MLVTEIGSTNISKISEVRSLWAESLGNSRICVAVLDGPVAGSHPCFNGAALTQLETLVPGIATYGSASRHGTHVASVIFGQHDSPIQGIAPNCRGLIVPIFTDGVDDSVVTCSQLDLARAITQAVEQGANVINISGGQLSSSNEPDQLLAQAVQLCAENNVLIVAAAGNDGCQCLHVPAALPTVLAVGAMNAQELPFDFSNWGDVYQTQGILAPGENILGAVPGGGTILRSGTSFATPIVSGIVALLLSIQLQRGDKPDPQAVCAAILKNALPCHPKLTDDCRRFLAGSLNIPKVYAFIIQQKGERQVVTNQKPEEAQFQPSQPSSPVQNITSEQPNIETVQAGADDAFSLDASLLPSMKASAVSTTLMNIASSNEKTLAITPSGECGCGGGKPIQLVYALGELGFDFGTEARLDFFAQAINPDNPTRNFQKANFLSYLGSNLWEAQSLIWTLNLDATPIYAIVPSGAFASVAYERLSSFLSDNNIERVSIPGYIAGSARLLSGQVVPAIIPEIRGMYAWNVPSLLEFLRGAAPQDTSAEKLENQLDEYLNRIYYDFRNLGITPQERALNFSATNVIQVRSVLRDAINAGLSLDTIQVEKSPICRPGSDCYDVKLQFFDPENNARAIKVSRFTIDVSDVIPVSVGQPRSWSLPGRR